MSGRRYTPPIPTKCPIGHKRIYKAGERDELLTRTIVETWKCEVCGREWERRVPGPP